MWDLRILVATAVFVSIAPVASTAVAGGVTKFYVDADASPGGDGLSWGTAFDDLWDAIIAADPKGVGAIVDELWVAEGTYTPTFEWDGGSPRSVGFYLPKNLEILGGFIGNEKDAGDRDPIAHVTILSGELGDPEDPTDNSYHILRAFSGNTATSGVDGFTIRAGYALGGNERGAAALLDSGSPVFRNCRFENNFSIDDGGAVHGSGSPLFIDCVFVGNETGGQGAGGGAIYCSGSLTLESCAFLDNVSGRSGGAFWGMNVVMTDCTFDGNVSEGSGGALQGAGSLLRAFGCVFANNSTISNDGGAISSSATEALIIDCAFSGNSAFVEGGAISRENGESATLIGCRFVGNSADVGGAIYDQSDHLRLINTTFSGNTSATDGGGVWASNALALDLFNCTMGSNVATSGGGGVFSSSLVVSANNCVFWFNFDAGGADESAQIDATGSVTVNYSLVQGLTGAFGGVGNIDDDPAFVDLLGPDDIAGTDDDDLRLVPGSPCIDAADNDAVPTDEFDLDDDGNFDEATPFDGYGLVRFFDDPKTVDTGNGTAPIVDMGSFEFDGSTDKPADDGDYVGRDGGSWFDPENWGGGAVPDEFTDVFIDVAVVIDQQGAAANTVTIAGGGTLQITIGSLATQTVTIHPSGLLWMADPTALLEVGTMTTLGGAPVQWHGGAIHLQASGSWQSPGASIEFGCVDASSLILEAGSSVIAPSVVICAAGVLSGSGVITSDVFSDGVVAPGTSTGRLAIVGTFVQSSLGRLEVELAGYTPETEHDVLSVTETAMIDGSIGLTFLPEFVPELANRQSFLDAFIIEGTFADVTWDGAPGEFLFELEYADPDNISDDETAVRVLTTLSDTGPRLYVNALAPGGGTGQRWDSALNDLQAALEFATLFDQQIWVNEIWVTAGEYRPDRGAGDREASFHLFISGMEVYGGFSGDETELDDRDPVINVTILSGDLAGNDGASFAGNEENAYHVVTIATTGACELITDGVCLDGLTEGECNAFPDDIYLGDGTVCATGEFEPIVLDGFEIRGGNANHESEDLHRQGGGVYNNGQGAVIANCRLVGNFAQISGGGMLDGGHETMLLSCEFDGNVTLVDAGGYRSGTNAHLVDCIFDSNISDTGGGARATNSTVTIFEQCSFVFNDAGGGGGLAIENVQGTFAVTLTDCEFIGNTSLGVAIEEDCILNATGCLFQSNSGGAIGGGGDFISLDNCVLDGNLGGSALSGAAQFVISNSVFSDNTSPASGGAVFFGGEHAQFTDCTFLANTAATQGGAVYVAPESVATFSGGSFSGNIAPEGSAIYTRAGQIRGATSLLEGDELYNGGLVDPGVDGEVVTPGAILIEGTYRQTRAVDSLQIPRLHMDLGGPIAGVDHDHLDVSAGEVVLENGSLIVDLINEFMPELGQQFNLISAGTLTGRFDVAQTPGLPAGQYLNIDYDTGDVLASIELLDFVIAFEDVVLSDVSGTPTDGILVDVDNDDDLDLVLTIPNDPKPGFMAILLNAGVDGKGDWLGFGEPALTIVGNAPIALVAAPFNGDGFIDLAIANFGSHTISVFFSNADGTGEFTHDQDYPVESFPASIAAGSPGAGNAANLVSASEGDELVQFFENDGTGQFAYGQTFTSAAEPVDARFADVDQDGDDDLLIVRIRPSSDPSFMAVWLYNAETDEFEKAAFYDLEPQTTSLHITEFNGDGFPEVVTTTQLPGTISILANTADGLGVFEPPVPILIGDELRNLALADLDLDADTDLVSIVADVDAEPTTRIIRNDQNDGDQLTLATAIDLGSGGDPALVIVGDINGDGLDDLVAVNSAEEEAPGPGATLGVLLNATQAAGCAEDLNGNGIVNGADLILLLGAWGSNPGGPPDFDGDGIVGTPDLLTLLGAWGPCP